MAVSMGTWLIYHGLGMLFWLWLLCWGGAERVTGWRAWGLIGWFAGHWSAEQLRLYALLLLALQGIWFIGGLFSPAWRVLVGG